MEIWALFISILAFVLSLVQFLKDSSRQKKETTLTVYNELQNEVFSELNILFLKYPKDKFKELEPGNKDWESITNHLAKIERFSVGINSGIYSLRILNRLGGGYFIRIYDRMSIIIDKKRKDDVSKGKHYNEFELTVKKLKQLRKII